MTYMFDVLVLRDAQQRFYVAVTYTVSWEHGRRWVLLRSELSGGFRAGGRTCSGVDALVHYAGT